MNTLIVLFVGFAAGMAVMYRAAKWHVKKLEERFATERFDAGFKAYTNGVAMGMGVRPTFVLDGRLEHWSLDEQSVIAELTSRETYGGEE